MVRHFWFRDGHFAGTAQPGHLSLLVDSVAHCRGERIQGRESSWTEEAGKDCGTTKMDRLMMVRESKMSLSDYFPGFQNPETQHPETELVRLLMRASPSDPGDLRERRFGWTRTTNSTLSLLVVAWLACRWLGIS